MNRDGTVLAGSASTTLKIVLFRRSGTTWPKETDLTAGTAGGTADWANSGNNVGISDVCDFNTDGTMIVASATSDTNNNWGSLFTWTYSGGSWTRDALKLRGVATNTADQFGKGLSMTTDGTRLVVGSPTFGSSVGCVRFYVRGSGVWTAETSFCGAADYPDEIGSPEIGYSVTLGPGGVYAFAGGRNDNGNVGAAWGFKRTGSTWAILVKLVNPLGTATLFGTAVAMIDDYLAVSIQGFNANRGQVRIYTRSGDTWSASQTIDPVQQIQDQYYGANMRMVDNILGVTACSGCVPSNNYYFIYVR